MSLENGHFQHDFEHVLGHCDRKLDIKSICISCPPHHFLQQTEEDHLGLEIFLKNDKPEQRNNVL